MSWIEKITSDFIITTGDGQEYKPLWMNATKAVEYNISEFEFPNLAGTLVTRGTPKGARYNLEIYFQGEDHLDVSSEFEISANDNRPWTVTHPLYGSLTVQPTGLNFDNTNLNVTKITGTLIETITEDSPKTVVDPIDSITINKENTDETFIESFDVTPSTTDINSMTDSVSELYNEGVKVPILPEEAEEYFNLFNKANAAVLDATSDPLAAIRAMQTIIGYPALFQISVKARIDLLSEQFQLLRNKLENIATKSSKKIYEQNAAALMSAMSLAATTPIEGDYGNKNKVLEVIEILVADYNAYLADLDSLQSDNGGNTDSFIPDANSQIALNILINQTVSNLFTVALNSRQERSILLEDDSNVIILTHRFYGLDPSDNNINEFITNNSIGLNEMLQIKKGRKIVWYI